MDIFTIAWISWFTIFGIIEGIALFNKREGDTLSEHVWNWFAVKGEGSRLQWPRRIALWGFLSWLVIHFVTGGWV